VTEVAHPYLRDEILDAIRELADPEHQRVVWPRPIYLESFDEVIHWLYDDTRVFDDPEGSIGYYLRNPHEARVMHPLRRALDTLLDALGGDLTDEEYVASPLWNPVLDAARTALAVLEAGRTQVLCPARRSTITYEVCALSSPEHQAEVWPDPRRPDSFDIAVHILLTDTRVLSRPDAAIGRYLRNDAEARAMRRLCGDLLDVLADVGYPLEPPDQAYLASPKWAVLVETAAAAHAALEAPG